MGHHGAALGGGLVRVRVKAVEGPKGIRVRDRVRDKVRVRVGVRLRANPKPN